MFRRLKNILHDPGNHDARRRSRRCVPSLTESAACLEERVVLSAMGGHEHPAAHVAHHAVRRGAHALNAGHKAHALRHHHHAATAHARAAHARGAVSVAGGDPPASLLFATFGNGVSFPNTALINGTAPNTAHINGTAPNTALLNLTSPNTATLTGAQPTVGLGAFRVFASPIAQANFASLVAGFAGGTTVTSAGGGGSSPRFLITSTTTPGLGVITTDLNTGLGMLIGLMGSGTTGLSGLGSLASLTGLSGLGSLAGLTGLGTTGLGTVTGLSGFAMPNGLTSGTTLATSLGTIPVSVTSSGLITPAGSITPLGQMPLGQMPITNPFTGITTTMNGGLTGLNLVPVVI